jgi:hypothetical protein
MPRIQTFTFVAFVAVAAAAEKPRLVIVPFSVGEGASEKATSRFSALVSDELKLRTDAIDVVVPPVTKPTPDKAGGPKARPIPEALSALEAGRKAFDDLRFDDAIPSLKKGIELMLAEPTTTDFEVVQDALVKLAAANFRNGEEKDAKVALLDLARLAPGFVLPSGFPPVFQREYEKAQKRLDKLPRGQVEIEGPSGATAFLDGRDLGTVPVTAENVASGTHSVRVEGARGERFGQLIEVKSNVAKVKATFGAPPSRSPVNMVSNPNVSATVDESMAQRLAAYCTAAGANFALVGIVYRVSDTQLSSGTALFHAKRSAFAQLSTVTFDIDVLTANTESFKLADEVVKRTASLGSTVTAPFGLVTKKTQANHAVAKTDPGKVDLSGEDLLVAAPDRKTKVVLEPKARVLDKAANLVDPEAPPLAQPVDPPVAKPRVPVWVWVVVGSAAVAGAGVGGYFGIRELTRPVTGTVTASW